jgi:hypothetical protein
MPRLLLDEAVILLDHVVQILHSSELTGMRDDFLILRRREGIRTSGALIDRDGDR